MTGSSPRAWGTQILDPAVIMEFRFIPTSVGNSRGREVLVNMHSVHPHERGELTEIGPALTAGDGSSPRAWGTHRGLSTCSPACRFIPTSVGNSKKGLVVFKGLPVHPHERGELLEVDHPLWRYDGSSPRAWGTPTVLYPHWLFLRFIPTSVGNSCTARYRGRWISVHPHERGEL